MANGFPARYAGTCASCSKPIEIGQYISWSRREKGKAYHVNCGTPGVIPESTRPFIGHELKSVERTSGSMTELNSIEAIKAALARLEGKNPEPKTVAKPVSTSRKLTQKSPWYVVLEHLMTIPGFRVLLIGPPGTGKSRTSYELMTKLLGDCAELTMTEGKTTEQLLGQLVLDSGSTKWQNGPVADAIQKGTGVLINEIDRYSNEIMSLMYNLIDDRPSAEIDGKVIRATDGYRVVGTTNANVTAIPDAILDRFDAVLKCLEPHEDALSGLEPDNRALVVNTMKTADCSAWAWNRKPALRPVKAFQRMCPVIGEYHAARCAFGDTAEEILSIRSTASRDSKVGG